MNHADYLGVVNDMHLRSGLPWSIPITLSTSRSQADDLPLGSRIALVTEQGELRTVMTVEDKFGYDRQLEARNVYRTEDAAHPGVHVLYQQGEVLLGGPVRVLTVPQQAFSQYRLTPTQSRAQFVERGWKRYCGFPDP